MEKNHENTKTRKHEHSLTRVLKPWLTNVRVFVFLIKKAPAVLNGHGAFLFVGERLFAQFFEHDGHDVAALALALVKHLP